MSSAVDDLDARIIALFTARPAIGVLGASRELGVARGTVQARLERLTDRGVIASMAPTIDPGAMGFPVTAYCQLQIGRPPGRPPSPPTCATSRKSSRRTRSPGASTSCSSSSRAATPTCSASSTRSSTTSRSSAPRPRSCSRRTWRVARCRSWRPPRRRGGTDPLQPRPPSAAPSYGCPPNAAPDAPRNAVRVTPTEPPRESAARPDGASEPLSADRRTTAGSCRCARRPARRWPGRGPGRRSGGADRRARRRAASRSCGRRRRPAS